jgi:hypothetical protein
MLISRAMFKRHIRSIGETSVENQPRDIGERQQRRSLRDAGRRVTFDDGYRDVYEKRFGAAAQGSLRRSS